MAPTLFAVNGDQVRAWTGTALSLRLAWLLGSSDSLRVVRALRDLDVLRPPSRPGILKAVPGLALGTFLVTGGLAASPAQAVTRAEGSKASRWVKVNLGRLPSGYSEFASYPAAYRRAIYDALSASARSDLWVAHFANYRKTHPGLSAKQSAVLDDATRLAPQIIAGRQQGAVVEGLETAAVAARGESGAQAILMTLGPAGTQSAAPRSDLAWSMYGVTAVRTRRRSPGCVAPGSVRKWLPGAGCRGTGTGPGCRCAASDRWAAPRSW
ncbi:bacteriocin fulvocin C-related protein [Streptomyces sp. NPDC059802]|uniref:bacteriocin fulvocin C-related protein n=1 Tax=Streptomyces sp. NPDC059802 TaxID=3346952 RepID=UPI0036522071